MIRKVVLGYVILLFFNGIPLFISAIQSGQIVYDYVWFSLAPTIFVVPVSLAEKQFPERRLSLWFSLAYFFVVATLVSYVCLRDGQFEFYEAYLLINGLIISHPPIFIFSLLDFIDIPFAANLIISQVLFPPIYFYAVLIALKRFSEAKS